MPEIRRKLCFYTCKLYSIDLPTGAGIRMRHAWSFGSCACGVRFGALHQCGPACTRLASRCRDAAELAAQLYQEASPVRLIHIKAGELIHRSLLRVVHRTHALPCGVVMQRNHYCGRSLRYINKPFI